MIDYDSLYSLRYQVYCHEAHFLNPDNYPDGLEYDEYDAVSEHFVAANGNSNSEIAGTVRLVRWSDYLSFPTAAHFPLLLEKLGHLGYPLESTAEISRLCVSKQLRRRTTDKLLGIESFLDISDRRRKFPLITLELFKSIYLASKYDLGITHWIASFEDCFYRLLKQYGVHFELLIPDEIDYYGKVKIYGASLSHLEEELKIQMSDLYEEFFRERLDLS